MAVHPPTQLMLYIIHRSPAACFVQCGILCGCVCELCATARFPPSFLHIFPFPPFSCPSTPPPNPSFITFSTRMSHMTAGQNSQPPPGAPSSPPPPSPLPHHYCGAVAQVPAPGRAAYPLRPRSPSHLSSLDVGGSALSGSSSPLRIPRRTVHCGAVAKVPATGRAVYSLRVRSFLSTLTSFQNDSHRRLGDGRCSPQTICVPSFIPVLFAL